MRTFVLSFTTEDGLIINVCNWLGEGRRICPRIIYAASYERQLPKNNEHTLRNLVKSIGGLGIKSSKR